MTQCETILKHMQEHGSISTYEAFIDHKITRLPARISDLRREGYGIDRTMVTTKENGTHKTYAVYSLRGGKDEKQKDRTDQA